MKNLFEKIVKFFQSRGFKNILLISGENILIPRRIVISNDTVFSKACYELRQPYRDRTRREIFTLVQLSQFDRSGEKNP